MTDSDAARLDSIARPEDADHRLERPGLLRRIFWRAFLWPLWFACGVLGLFDPVFLIALLGTWAVAFGLGKLDCWLRTRPILRRAEQALQLLTTGRYGEGRDCVEASLRSERAMRNPLMLLLLSSCYSELGDYERAVRLAAEACRFPSNEGVKLACRRIIANIYLEAGDVSSARPWVVGDDALAEESPTIAAKLWARGDDRRRVLELAPRKPSGPFAAYSHGSARALNLIKAYVAELEGELELRDECLQLARPAYDDEHVPLVRNWPEMSAFLARHPLEVVPSAPGAKMPKVFLLDRGGG